MQTIKIKKKNYYRVVRDNQERYEMRGTLKILTFADYVNLMDENINTI
jgi:hypothetical protein